MKFILLAILLVGCNIMAATAQSDKIVDNRAIDTLDLKSTSAYGMKSHALTIPLNEAWSELQPSIPSNPTGVSRLSDEATKTVSEERKKRSWDTCISRTQHNLEF